MLMLTCAVVSADWRDHDKLPAWCRRGAVRWAHGFAKMGVPEVKLILYCGQNLKQSGRFADEDARKLARDSGLKFQPYICSKTIRWRRLFPEFPQLEKCTCLAPDGSRRLMYSNPERYAGCYNSPIWLDYIKMRIKKTIETKHPASIFFDNINTYNCYCDICREKFKKYTAEKFGVEMDLSEPGKFPNFGFAKTLFDADSTYEFFEKVKAYIRTLDPEVVISPNFHVGGAWTTYLTARGTPDLVFYEEGHSFPPFTNQVIGYKVGLAASHGRVVGQLLGLPPTVGCERALRWSDHWETALREAFMYPEEYELATAEAAACDGTFIPSFCIREQNIYVSDDPHQKAVHQALHRYNEFLKKNQALYNLAQPGSNIAVLHSVWSRLVDPKRYWRSFRETCRALMDADYVKNGGGIVVFGETARADRLGRTYPNGELPELATLSGDERRSLGKGRVWQPESPLNQMPPEQLASGIEFASGGIRYRVLPPSRTLFANVLKSRDGSMTSLHLVNYDFHYKRPPAADIADDDGFAEARTYFADTKWRAKKILIVRDPASIEQPFVRSFGHTMGANIQMVVSFNGRDIKTFPADALRDTQWHETPVPKELLREKNEIVLRVIGSPNYHPDYFNLSIDTTAKTRRSAWSTDEGKTYSTDDLSRDLGIQTGEYLIRLSDGPREKNTVKPEDLAGLLTVNPAGPVQIHVRLENGKAPAGMLLSPDHEPVEMQPKVHGDVTIYEAPKVHIYDVLVIPADACRKRLPASPEEE